MPRVIAVDAGFQCMGVSIIDVEKHSDIPVFWTADRTKKNTTKTRGLRVADDDARRASALADALFSHFVAYRPNAIVVELPTGGAQGARANRCMGFASGIIVAVTRAPGIYNLPVEWVTPRAVKLAAAKKSDASKEEVQAGVEKVFPGKIPWGTIPMWAQEHIADSLGAFLAFRDSNIYKLLKSMAQ